MTHGMQPVSVYVNWTAYDELSDNVELTEALAMQQFDELLRLRSQGVRLDCYLMDAFWYDVDDGYRTWRKPHWPDGPGRWLAACREHGVIPGLWVSTNSLLCHLRPYAGWEDSLNRGRTAMCMFDGPFLADFLQVLQHWTDRGIRVFKFDFARFGAATPNAEGAHLPHEIVALNHAALRTALCDFRQRNPAARLLAYNGFGGIQENTSKPFHKTVDVRLLDVFDSLYCGDPCPADVPMMSFWRAVDVYSDHQVRQYERNGVPLERIDNSAFMIGRTAACYRRGLAAWKGMLILSLARGGLVNTYYGNLELLDDEKAVWFAKAQALFLELQALGRFRSFGGIPGRGEAYGYIAQSTRGALYTVVNPSESFQDVGLPPAGPERRAPDGGRVLFTDVGCTPALSAGVVTLGPGQMCVVGCGAYDDEACELGVEPDVAVPTAVAPVPATFERCGHNEIRATLTPPADADLRIHMIQSADGIAYRSRGGGQEGGQAISEILRIRVRQSGAELATRIVHDRPVWSGLSWAMAEVSAADLARSQPVEIVCSSAETQPLGLSAAVCSVRYAGGQRSVS